MLVFCEPEIKNDFSGDKNRLPLVIDSFSSAIKTVNLEGEAASTTRANEIIVIRQVNYKVDDRA